MNGYFVTIYGDNYRIELQAMGHDGEDAFEQALYTLINSEQKIDLFGHDLKYEAEFVEVVE